MFVNEDNVEYFRFTTPSRIDRAVHTLEGLLDGISADGKVNSTEMKALTAWVGDHSEFADRHPFNEIIARLREALFDGIFDEEERADVLWLCNRFKTENNYYDAATSDMQRLQGMLGGIAIDGEITKAELEQLSVWLEEHEHLRRIYPYDELESLILQVLKDGVIDQSEHDELMRFFMEFLSHAGHRAIELPITDESNLISGLCAVCPDIQFTESLFCFTGRSERCSRSALIEILDRVGGRFSKAVRQDLDYLIVGADGNDCWAYSCYGRKVEKAVEYRKKGHPILIVHENDFWDELADEGIT